MTRRRKRKITTDALTKDGFANFAARSGVRADNVISESTYLLDTLTRNRLKLEAMYRGSWIVGAVIDSVAEDMTRGGVTITGSIEPEKTSKIQTKLTRLGIWRTILEAIKWGRLYGGAIAAIVIDGQDCSTPLDMRTISQDQFVGLRVYDRWSLQPSLSETVTGGRDIGLPEYYDVVSDIKTGAVSGIRWHHSRVIRFIGIQLPMWQSVAEQLWGESIIERMYDRLVSFDAATLGASNLVEKAHLRTVQIDGLRDVFAAGGAAEENLLKMFHYMRRLQTNQGLTLLDKEDSFQTYSYSFGGLSDVILQFGQQISGATGIPLVRLFGQSPSGLNSTGESDLRMYYDHILAQQESRLRDGLLLVLQVLYRSLFQEDAPSDFDFEFSPLWQTGGTEKASIATVITDSVLKAYDAGIIDHPTALKELRQSSEQTGIFSNITEDAIKEADMSPPPMPVESEPVSQPFKNE